MDVLTDVLSTLELKGWLSSRRELAHPWRYDFAASRDSIFHLLSFGGGYLYVAGESAPRRVEDGGGVLFPQGPPHPLCGCLPYPPHQAGPLAHVRPRRAQVLSTHVQR